MIPADFTIEMADWSNPDDHDACCTVREQVFVVEQRVPREDEEDEFDARSRHVLARDLQGKPIGTGRMTADAVIGRMAVLKGWRGRQVGAAILGTLIQQARALAYSAVELHAQIQAVPFYEKYGFATYGEEFVECAIRHFHMRMELTPQPAPERPAPPPRPEVRSVAIESREQALTEVLRLIGDARRELCIYTRDLDPALFDNEQALEALKHLAITGRGASIRILVQEPQLPAQRGHRLIGLAQRLTSAFAFRTPVQDEDLQYAPAFLINDTRGFYFRTLGNRYEGEVINYAPGRHAQLQEYFNQVWERSEPSDELRQLAL
jgi:predicted GNAT family N-acyltransferase